MIQLLFLGISYLIVVSISFAGSVLVARDEIGAFDLAFFKLAGNFVL